MTGAAFSALNLWLLSRIAAELVRAASRKRRILSLLALKFAIIYPVIIGVLAFRAVSLAAFAVGFTGVLAAAAVKAAVSPPVEIRHV